MQKTPSLKIMQKSPSLTLPRKREREFFQKHGGICMVLKVNWYDCVLGPFQGILASCQGRVIICSKGAFPVYWAVNPATKQ